MQRMDRRAYQVHTIYFVIFSNLIDCFQQSTCHERFMVQVERGHSTFSFFNDFFCNEGVVVKGEVL